MNLSTVVRNTLDMNATLDIALVYTLYNIHTVCIICIFVRAFVSEWLRQRFPRLAGLMNKNYNIPREEKVGQKRALLD